MDLEYQNIEGLKVVVDKVMYVPDLETPAGKPFAFVYFITIKNSSKLRVTLKGRKWIVREAEGECTVVEGPGIVGEMPKLSPGEEFSYNSCHVIKSEASVQGAFFGSTDSGGYFSVRIPDFTLRLPPSGD